MKGDKFKGCNVSMPVGDWLAIDAYANSLGLNRSAALRVILSEWRQFKASQRHLVDTPAPYLTKEAD